MRYMSLNAREAAEDIDLELSSPDYPIRNGGECRVGSAATRVRRAVADSFIVGFRWALTLAAALAVLGALIAWLVIENKSYRRSGGETPPG